MEMTEPEIKVFKWQDWTLFGLRWLFIVGVLLSIALWNWQNNLEPFSTEMAVALGIGIVTTIVFAASIAVHQMNIATPYILILTDAILAGLFVYLTHAQPLFLIGITASLTVTGLLYLGPLFGSFQALTVISVALGTMIYQFGAEELDFLANQYALPAAIITVIILVAGGWAFAYGKYDQGQKRQLNKLAKAKARQLEEMRERARTITDMTNALIGTMNYQKVLDAALDIGQFSLHKQANQRLVSMVLLFRSSDNALYIANQRGLRSFDENRAIRGTEGIVGRTLKECVPIILNNNAYKDPELISLGGFAGIESALCVPLRAHYDNYGVLLYGSQERNAFSEDHIDTLNTIGFQATVALQNAVLYNSLMEEKERIIQMEEDARKALVRDLHDIPTQTISAVAMRIRIIMRMLERTPQDVPHELQTVEEMALRATEEIRHVLFKLRPLALESQGLNAALQQLAEKMQKTYHQAMSVRVGADVEKYLDTTKQGALFYLIEEAVNNARKYAQASLISVQIGRQSDVLVIRIADNGVGFDADAVNSSYNERGSFGMVNMRERAELMDGNLTIKSSPGRGTTLTVKIPIEPEKTRSANGRSERPRLPATKLTETARAQLER